MNNIVFESNKNLKNCPFCNSKAWLGLIEYPDNEIWYNPSCSECKCGWMENYETKYEAIMAWNKRGNGD